MSILGPIFNMLLKCDKVMHGEQNLILSLSIICFILICAAVSGRDYICQSQFLVCLCSPIAHLQSLSICQTQREHHFSPFQKTEGTKEPVCAACQHADQSACWLPGSLSNTRTCYTFHHPCQPPTINSPAHKLPYPQLLVILITLLFLICSLSLSPSLPFCFFMSPFLHISSFLYSQPSISLHCSCFSCPGPVS